jgi:hypothetical protein
MAKNDGRFGHALNSIASINKSTGRPIGKALAGLRLRYRDVPNAHLLLIQKILPPQVFWSQAFNASTQASSSSAESC